MYVQENFAAENPEVPPLPAGWSTVDKKAFLISSDVFNILCGICTILFAFCFAKTHPKTSKGAFGEMFNSTDFLFNNAKKYSGYDKTITAYNSVDGTDRLIFVVALILGVVAIVMGIIRMIYDANTEWQALDYTVPELEGDVDVSVPN